MKIKTHGIFLSLFLALTVSFLFAAEASAHEYRGYSHSPDLDINAESVGVGDRDDIEKMTRHLARHIALIQEDSNLSRPEQAKETVILAQQARKEGVFNNGEVYSILVNPEGYILNHGSYPDLHFKRYSRSFEFKDGDGMAAETVQTLLGSGEDPTCVGYRYGGQDRTVCAMETEIFTAGGRTINVMGLHHAEDDYKLIEKDNPNCNNDPLYSLSVTAKQVDDEEDPQEKEKLLVQYVKEVAEKFRERSVRIVLQIFREDPRLFSGLVPDAEEEIGKRSVQIALKTTSCIAEGDYREGSIYPFMLEPDEGLAVLSGLDFHRYGLSVSLTDPDPIQCDGANILEALRNAVTNGSGDLADLAAGNNGFITYHWDDPGTPEDNNEGYLERDEVPGSSIKKSYIEVIDTTPPELAASGAPPTWRIVGSGIYLDDAEYCKEDDEGCAISATANTPQSAVLNLFLVASVLFSAVFLRTRVS